MFIVIYFSVLFYESSYNRFHDVIINTIISNVSPKLYMTIEIASCNGKLTAP